MRTLPIAFSILMLGCLAMTSQADNAQEAGQAVPVALLQSSGVRGSLGYPLGKLVTVEGEIADSSGSKADLDRVRLKVEKIEGQPLAGTPTVTLAFFAFSHDQKSPKPGARVRYIGYETGGFEGIPSEAFKVMPAVATEGFHFALRFQVCKQLE